MAGLIADGVHLDAAFLKVALRAKGMGRVVLVFGCRRVVLAGGDRLAASALRMDRAIGGVMEMAGVRWRMPWGTRRQPEASRASQPGKSSRPGKGQVTRH